MKDEDKIKSQEELRKCCGLMLPYELAVVLNVGLMMLSSITIVTYNNRIFKGRLPYPIFVSLAQQFIGVLFIFFANLLKPKKKESKSSNLTWKEHSIRFWYVLPVSVCFSLTISLNNLTLMFAHVATYSVAKSTTLIWASILQYYLLSIKLSWLSIMACFIMILGLFINSLDPTTLSLYALIFGLLSSIFQALNNVCVARALPKCGGDSSDLLMRNQFMSTGFLAIYLLSSNEVGKLWYSSGCFDFGGSLFWTNWSLVLGSALLAICINQFTYRTIGLTSPTAFNVAGLSKAALQSLVAWTIFGESYTINSLSGVFFSLSGSSLYVYAGSRNKNSKEYSKEARLSIATGSDMVEISEKPEPEVEKQAILPK